MVASDLSLLQRPDRLGVKVLHVIPSVSDKHGGPTYALHAFARAAQLRGIDVVIATTDDDGGRRRLNVRLGQLFQRRGLEHVFFRRDLLFYKVSFGLARWLKQNVCGFDLVHIHALFSFSSYAAARAARRQRVPYVIRPLGVLNRWGIENRRPFIKQVSLRFVELPILRHAAAIHYTAEAERHEAVSLRPEISSFPSFIGPVPVEPPPYTASREQFEADFPAASGKKLVLFLSRLDPKKGLELLIDAFAAVKSLEPDALLVLAGEGDDAYVHSLRRFAEQLTIKSDVLWCGHLAAERKAAALAAATVFVLPSHSENFGIAAAEAMAAGVPTVITDQVGLSEFAAKYNAALIVRPDKNALAQAIRSVLTDPAVAQQYAEHGRRLVDEVFSSRTIGDQLGERYSEIIAGWKRTSCG